MFQMFIFRPRRSYHSWWFKPRHFENIRYVQCKSFQYVYELFANEKCFFVLYLFNMFMNYKHMKCCWLYCFTVILFMLLCYWFTSYLDQKLSNYTVANHSLQHFDFGQQSRLLLLFCHNCWLKSFCLKFR